APRGRAQHRASIPAPRTSGSYERYALFVLRRLQCRGYVAWLVLLDSIRLRGQQRGRQQFRVHVFGQFLELAVRDAANPAVAIVVGLPCLRGDATAALDRDVVAFRDDPMQRIGVSVRELRE